LPFILKKNMRKVFLLILCCSFLAPVFSQDAGKPAGKPVWIVGGKFIREKSGCHSLYPPGYDTWVNNGGLLLKRSVYKRSFLESGVYIISKAVASNYFHTISIPVNYCFIGKIATLSAGPFIDYMLTKNNPSFPYGELRKFSLGWNINFGFEYQLDWQFSLLAELRYAQTLNSFEKKDIWYGPGFTNYGAGFGLLYKSGSRHKSKTGI
jgi:hypothetical protein